MKSKFNFTIKNENGIYDMHELGIWVNDFVISSPSPYRNKRYTRHGVRLKNSRMRERSIFISMLVESDSVIDFDNLTHLIYKAFYSKEEMTITRDLFPKTEIRAVQELEYDIKNITCSDGTVDIELSMYEPYLIGNEKSITVNSADQYLINGESFADWTATIDFTKSVSKYELEHDQGKITVNFNFEPGDVLFIDFVNRDIMLNDNNMDVGLSVESVWFYLQPGYNQLKASSKTEMKYRERFI